MNSENSLRQTGVRSANTLVIGTSMFLVSLLALLLTFQLTATPAGAQEAGGSAYVVAVPSATIFAEPSESGAQAGRLTRGKSIKSNGEKQNGFIGLSTKSGRRLWAKESDVRAVASDLSLEEDLEKSPADKMDRSRSDVWDWSLRYPPRATFDLGASTGSYTVGRTTISYTEFNLGLNLYFADWLAWRNAVWTRFASGADTIFGLDTSARGILDVGDSTLGLTVFAGPGWRFPSQGNGVPFAEVGLVVKLRAVALGGGARTFLNSWVTSGSANETQLFLIVAGGGSL